jgi:endonuclease-3
MKHTIIMQVLDETIPDPQPSLHFDDPFELLIAVLLSARCTDRRVNEVAPQLFAIAHTPEQMAKLSPQQIEAVIRPCGLASFKARAIVQLSRDLIQYYHGCVPQTLEELQKLPGVGRKVASVVACMAFDQHTFPVDTHIHRCAKRWQLSKGKTPTQTERALKRIFPPEFWRKLHLQILLFARKYCPARGHKKSQCPICRHLPPSSRKPPARLLPRG